MKSITNWCKGEYMYGIVTFHDGFNFGAFLQVYALQNRLAELGIENEIINYKNRKHWLNEYLCFLRTKDPVKLCRNIIKIVKFRKAQKQLRQTKYLSSAKALNGHSYEGVIFGSDEVWNYNNPLFGKDLFYFGKGVNSKKLISYAASFGSINKDDEFDGEASALIRKFSAVSVRDENSFAIANKITGTEAARVLDPTLLYDFTGKEVECKYDNFIMLYTTGLNPEAQKAVADYAEKKGKKLVSVGWMNRFCKINEIAIGPFEFLGFVKKADEIITSMYHGTLFSIKYNKQFCVISDPYRVNKMSVLKTLGTEDRICAGNDIESIMARKIEYETVNQILKREREKSEWFILNAVRE